MDRAPASPTTDIGKAGAVPPFFTPRPEQVELLRAVREDRPARVLIIKHRHG